MLSTLIICLKNFAYIMLYATKGIFYPVFYVNKIIKSHKILK
jgi:hypothetical protein